MRRFVHGFLVLVLAALPLPVRAQDIAPAGGSESLPGEQDTRNARPIVTLGRPVKIVRRDFRPLQIWPSFNEPEAIPSGERFPVPIAISPSGEPMQVPIAIAPWGEAGQVPIAMTPWGDPGPVPVAITPHSVVAMPEPAVEQTPPESAEAEVQPARENAKPTAAPASPATKRSNFFGFAELLYWNVHNSGVPYAQAFDGTDPILSVPRGSVGVANMDYTGGFRVGAGLSLSDVSGVACSFTSFQDSAQSRVEAPRGSVLHSNLLFPNTVNAAFTPMTADADYNIRLRMGDLDYKHAILDHEGLQLNWLTGIRYGQLEQTLSARYQETPGSETVASRISFDGIGPRVGVEGEYRIAGGLFAYCKGILDLLAGRFGGTYEQRDVLGGLVAETEIAEKRLVPVAEFELGGGWVSAGGHLLLSGGYSVSNWYNTLTTPLLVRGIQNNDFTTNGSNFRGALSFDGLAGRIELRY